MSDLISRKSLYDKMCEAEELALQRVIDTPTSFPSGSLNPAYIRYVAQLNERTKFKEMIYDEPSAQPEQQWIPCSVKYPESDECVLVTSGGYDCYVWDCMSNRGDDYFWEDEKGFYHNKYEVVAWMPLPKYESEED